MIRNLNAVSIETYPLTDNFAGASDGRTIDTIRIFPVTESNGDRRQGEFIENESRRFQMELKRTISLCLVRIRMNIGQRGILHEIAGRIARGRTTSHVQ